MINLEDYIQRYYKRVDEIPADVKPSISKIVEEKINSLVLNETELGYLKSWNQLVAELALDTKIPAISNMSYLQYPNLKLSFVGKEVLFDKYRITRNTNLIISLLCPHYTFYHELSSFFESRKGSVKIGSTIFLREKLFEIDDKITNDIDKLVGKYFEQLRFVYHLDIFTATFYGEPPWGATGLERQHFSAHEYLFDFATDSQILP
jgi:hypothetical protein